MEEAELTETPDAEVTEEREEWTIERTWSGTITERKGRIFDVSAFIIQKCMVYDSTNDKIRG